MYQDKQVQEESVDGLNTRIHTTVNVLGNPIKFISTRGQYSKMKQAEALIQGFLIGAI